MKKYVLKSVIIGLCVISLFSCKDKTDDKIICEEGVFLSNEGQFNAGNGSLSFYSFDDNKVYNNVYKTNNGVALGDVIQSGAIIDGKLFLVANGSNKVEVVDSRTIDQKGVIVGVTSPRYVVGAGNSKVYISTWNNEVVSVNTDNYSIINKIAVGNGAEKMLVKDEKLFVTCSGGYSVDSNVYVIDIATDAVIDIINVGYNPSDIEIDANGDIWVLCSGGALYGANYSVIATYPSSFVKLTSDYSGVVSSDSIPGGAQYKILDKNKLGNKLLLGGGYGFAGVQVFDIDSNSFTGTVISDALYGFNVNPSNGDIYVGIAPSFTESGSVIRYSETGEKLGEYTVGIGPNGAIFK